MYSFTLPQAVDETSSHIEYDQLPILDIVKKKQKKQLDIVCVLNFTLRVNDILLTF